MGGLKLRRAWRWRSTEDAAGVMLAFNLLFYLNKLENGFCFQPQAGILRLHL